MADDDVIQITIGEDCEELEPYRANIATPRDLESMRFWVQQELKQIESAFSRLTDYLECISGEIVIPGDGGSSENECELTICCTEFVEVGGPGYPPTTTCLEYSCDALAAELEAQGFAVLPLVTTNTDPALFSYPFSESAGDIPTKYTFYFFWVSAPSPSYAWSGGLAAGTGVRPVNVGAFSWANAEPLTFCEGAPELAVRFRTPNLVPTALRIPTNYTSTMGDYTAAFVVTTYDGTGTAEQELIRQPGKVWRVFASGGGTIGRYTCSLFVGIYSSIANPGEHRVSITQGDDSTTYPSDRVTNDLEIGDISNTWVAVFVKATNPDPLLDPGVGVEIYNGVDVLVVRGDNGSSYRFTGSGRSLVGTTAAAGAELSDEGSVTIYQRPHMMSGNTSTTLGVTTAMVAYNQTATGADADLTDLGDAFLRNYTDYVDPNPDCVTGGDPGESESYQYEERVIYPKDGQILKYNAAKGCWEYADECCPEIPEFTGYQFQFCETNIPANPCESYDCEALQAKLIEEGYEVLPLVTSDTDPDNFPFPFATSLEEQNTKYTYMFFNVSSPTPAYDWNGGLEAGTGVRPVLTDWIDGETNYDLCEPISIATRFQTPNLVPTALRLPKNYTTVQSDYTAAMVVAPQQSDGRLYNELIRNPGMVWRVYTVGGSTINRYVCDCFIGIYRGIEEPGDHTLQIVVGGGDKRVVSNTNIGDITNTWVGVFFHITNPPATHTGSPGQATIYAAVDCLVIRADNKSSYRVTVSGAEDVGPNNSGGVELSGEGSIGALARPYMFQGADDSTGVGPSVAMIAYAATSDSATVDLDGIGDAFTRNITNYVDPDPNCGDEDLTFVQAPNDGDTIVYNTESQCWEFTSLESGDTVTIDDSKVSFDTVWSSSRIKSELDGKVSYPVFNKLQARVDKLYSIFNDMAITAPLTIAGSGTVNATGTLAGTAGLAITPAANLVGGVMAGTASMAFSTSADLQDGA